MHARPPRHRGEPKPNPFPLTLSDLCSGTTKGRLELVGELIDPDEALRRRRRLAREEAQRRFDTIGLPRPRSLDEAAAMWPGVSL